MYYDTKFLESLRSKISELVPADLKNAEFLEVFNSAIKIWEPGECLYRLCKTCIHQADLM